MAISYKSYCWVVGTTSFRTSQLNRKIELQLQYLDEFWNDPRYVGQGWKRNKPLHAAYYRFLKEKGFLEGEAKRPDKDAREKILGLRNLGLVNEERRITDAGKRVLSIARDGDFGVDTSNVLDLPKDSYRYFLQLLKTSKQISEGYGTPLVVRPFVVLLHVLNQIIPDANNGKHLRWSEFTYLLPMCVNAETTAAIVGKINASRRAHSAVDIDATILSLLLRMDNYKEALGAFIAARTVDEELICTIGMNRKSGENGNAHYDAAYRGVFNALHAVVFKGITKARLLKFLQALGDCNLRTSWIGYFFDKGAGERLPNDLLSALRRDNPVLQAQTEVEFRTAFFKVMHLLKAKATFRDYADLNRRYFKLSDVVVFNDDIVELDLLPKAFVAKVGSWLETEAFRDCTCLEQDVALDQIITTALPRKEELVVAATGRPLESFEDGDGIKAVLKAERYARFATMLHEKFPVATIAKLLEMIENRAEDRANDAMVQKLVTDDASVPTIFEYVVGLAWYYVSGEKGDVLEYMNLSLGPDFLPKSHAVGGEADIVWQYAANLPFYDKHALLIEATVADRVSQRRMEMEPVSRHMGQYMLKHPDERQSYCTFVTPCLDLNVISDFRGKKRQRFYNPNDCKQYVDGMKIIPIDTKMLRTILKRGLQYPFIYQTFDDCFNREGNPAEWHDALRLTIEG